MRETMKNKSHNCLFIPLTKDTIIITRKITNINPREPHTVEQAFDWSLTSSAAAQMSNTPKSDLAGEGFAGVLLLLEEEEAPNVLATPLTGRDPLATLFKDSKVLAHRSLSSRFWHSRQRTCIHPPTE